MKRKLILSLWALLAAVLPACGSRTAPRLMVGTVDSARVLQSNPQYEEQAAKYLRDRVDTMREAFGDLPSDSFQVDQDLGTVTFEPEAQEQIVAKEREINERWAKITQEFVTRGHEAIRKAAEEICAEKGIDVVLIDSKLYPTVEFGAIDITEDIMRKMSGPDAGSPDAGKGSPKEESR